LEKVTWRLFLSTLRAISMRCRPVLGVPRGCTIVAMDPKQSREENLAAAEGVAGSFRGWSVLCSFCFVPQRDAL
jgi:hypothetical protein